MLRAVNQLDRMTVPKIIDDPHEAIRLHADMSHAIEWVHSSSDDVLPADGPTRMAEVERKLRRIRERAQRALFKFVVTDPLRKSLAPIARNLHAARKQLRKETRAELDRREGDDAINPVEVANAVHARLRPDVEISLGYIRNMTSAICRGRWMR